MKVARRVLWTTAWSVNDQGLRRLPSDLEDRQAVTTALLHTVIVRASTAMSKRIRCLAAELARTEVQRRDVVKVLRRNSSTAFTEDHSNRMWSLQYAD